MATDKNGVIITGFQLDFGGVSGAEASKIHDRVSYGLEKVPVNTEEITLNGKNLTIKVSAGEGFDEDDLTYVLRRSNIAAAGACATYLCNIDRVIE